MSAVESTLGIKIYLREEYTQDTDIGLYTSAGESEIRLIENDLTNLAAQVGETWKTGLLKKRAFGSFSESFDGKKGGNIASRNTTSCSIINTSRFSKDLSDSDIYLRGCKAEIWEFRRDTTTGNIVTYVMYYGVVSDVDYDELYYTVTIADSNENRDTYLTHSENGEDYYPPVTFGYHSPEITGVNNYAKFTRKTHEESLFRLYHENNYEYSGENILIRTFAHGSVDGETRFPVVDVLDTLSVNEVQILISEVAFVTINDIDISVYSNTYDFTPHLLGKYMYCVEANGDVSNSQGYYRRITAAELDKTNGDLRINITYANQFPYKLDGNEEVDSDNQCILQIFDMEFLYSSDTFKCGGFLKEKKRSGIDVNPEETVDDDNLIYVYVYDEQVTTDTTQSDDETTTQTELQDFVPVPINGASAYGNIEGITTSTNLIELKPESVFDKSVLTGYNFYPLHSFQNYNNPTLEGRIDNGDRWHKLIDGFYVYDQNSNFEGTDWDSDALAGANLSVSDTGSLLYVLNNDPDQSYRRELSATNFLYRNRFAWAFKGRTTYIEDYIRFKKLFLGLSIITSNTVNSADHGWYNFYVKYKHWYPSTKHILSSTIAENFDDRNAGGYVRNLPKLYWNDNFVPGWVQGGDNEYFVTANTTNVVSGANNFVLAENDDYEKANSITEILIIITKESSNNYQDTVDAVDIKSMSLILENQTNIRDSVYSPFAGRVYDDTWGGRVTSTDVITEPHRVIEHALRLGNWSEVGDSEPTDGWGSDYAANALVDTSSNYGGMDSSVLESIGGLSVARQIFDKEECSRSSIIKSLCKAFHLVSWRKNYATTASGDTGKECLTYLLNDEAASDSIDLTDIMGNVSNVKELESRDVYCEPVINYCYNVATSKYEKQLKITNTSAGTGNFDSSYAEGFSGSSAEATWEIGAALYQKYGIVNEMPSDLSDQRWVYDDVTAQVILYRIMKWQQIKRITINVSYNKARSYYLTQKVSLSLPHQTNSTAVNCIIEKINKNYYDNKVTLGLIMLDDVDYDGFYYKDTWETVSNDWQDDTETYSDRGSTGLDDKKKVM